MRQFYMDKSHSLSTPMIMRSLDINIQFKLKRRMKSFLMMKLYLGAIRALVHLTNNIWPDICFAINLLARFSFFPIKGHWNGVEHVIEYPRRTIVMDLFIPRNPRQNWLVTQMQNIYLIRIKLYLKHAICLHVEAQ